ncbi:MAG TPA: ParB/RepB/Spo0J family partition protein [Firmicutes bacterium]|nr:ParB/RepB/Spo0J family partition protein [Bacillota bacterium]
MAKGRRALGKGLWALLPEEAMEEKQGIQEISIEEIVPNPYQPRIDFDEEKLQGLAESIRQHGVMQPIVVTKGESGYVLVVGERRWRAAQLAGLKRIPAIIQEVDDRKMMEWALIENVQREDLNPLEEARAYERLIEEFGLTQQEVADAVGKGRSTITNMLRILQTTPFVQGLVAKEVISVGHAKALAGIADPSLQDTMARYVVKRSLSVRQTEALVEKGSVPRGTSENVPRGTLEKRTNPQLALVQSELGDALGTKVVIKQQKNKGRIEIEYYSEEELQRIIDLILRD